MLLRLNFEENLNKGCTVTFMNSGIIFGHTEYNV